MRRFGLLSGCVALLSVVSTAAAAEISGEYLEARTCDVYTGPCFANGEVGIAGKLAKIETRALVKGDCVCSNESVFYPPLNKVDNAHPAYTLNMTFEGQGLDQTWSQVNKRSAFMGTFER